MDERIGAIRQLFWNPEEKRLRAPVRIPVLFALVLLVVQLLFAVIAGIELLVTLPGPVTNAVVLVLATVAIAGLSWFIDRRRLRDLGLGGGRTWLVELLVGLGAGLAMSGVAVATLAVAGAATIGSGTAAAPDIALGGNAVGVFYGVVFFGGVGLLEEVLVRGYLLVNVAEGIRGFVDTDRTATLVGVVGTAGLFGVLHAANPGGTALSLVNISLAGLFFGLVYAMTGRLAFPIGIHITWNFGLGVLFGLPVSGLVTDTAVLAVETTGRDLLTGGSFGPEGGLVMLVALAAGVVVFLAWMWLQGDTLSIDGEIAVPELWNG